MPCTLLHTYYSTYTTTIPVAVSTPTANARVAPLDWPTTTTQRVSCPSDRGLAPSERRLHLLPQLPIAPTSLLPLSLPALLPMSISYFVLTYSRRLLAGCIYMVQSVIAPPPPSNQPWHLLPFFCKKPPPSADPPPPVARTSCALDTLCTYVHGRFSHVSCSKLRLYVRTS